MKTEQVKTTSNGLSAIKAKTLQLSPDLRDVKPSSRQVKTSYDFQSPSVLTVRYLTSSRALHHHHDVSSRQDQNKQHEPQMTPALGGAREEPFEDRSLHPVELTLNKKFKFASAKNEGGGDKLTSSDKQILDHLRHHLRSQPHRNDTTSVLEAIADPEVREKRLYYEPLNSLLSDKNRLNIKTKQGGGGNDPFSLGIVNIMIPALQGRGTGRHDHRISNPFMRNEPNPHVTAADHDAAFPFLPKVVGSGLQQWTGYDPDRQKLTFPHDRHEPDQAQKHQPAPDPDQQHYHQQQQQTRLLVATATKQQLNLPRIEISRGGAEGEPLVTRRGKRVTLHDPDLVPLPPSGDDVAPAQVQNCFPARRTTTTANGKAHLVGPTNKMDVIADYRSAMRGGLITYDEYIRNLSALSLHKVTLANSNVQRHFHLVRDQQHDMKPRLAHVDINPVTSQLPKQPRISLPHALQLRLLQPPHLTNGASKTNENDQKAADNGNPSHKPGESDTLSGGRHLHRVDITLADPAMTSSTDVAPATREHDIVTTDLARYSHVHHPLQGRSSYYHWNHDPGASGGADSSFNGGSQFTTAGRLSTTQRGGKRSRLLPQHGKSMTRASTKLRNKMDGRGESPKDDSEKQALAIFIQQRTGTTADDKSAGGGGGFDPVRLNPDEIVPLRAAPPTGAGKLPLVTSAEFMDFDADQVLRSLDHGFLKATALGGGGAGGAGGGETDDELSDGESVFQAHLDNMLRSIKKAKTRKPAPAAGKVPELIGLAPSVTSSAMEPSPHAVGGAREASVVEIDSHLPELATATTRSKVETRRPARGVVRSTPTPISGGGGGGSPLNIEDAPPILTVQQLDATEVPGHRVVLDKNAAQPSRPGGSPDRKAPTAAAARKATKVTSASVDLVSGDEAELSDGGGNVRLAIVIKSTPAAPPGSVSSDESASA